MIPLGGDAADHSGLNIAAWLRRNRAHEDRLGALIRRFDSFLRRRHGIREFCSDRRCIMSVALAYARYDVCLADGTRIRPGQLIGELHLRNEQFPRMRAKGPSLDWALVTRRAFAHSLDLLARHVDGNSAFTGIEAFRGEITFAGPPSRQAKVARVVTAHGFELVERRPGALEGLQALLDGLAVRFLTRAFNPAAPTHRLQRHRYELWMSRRRLLERCRPHAPAPLRDSETIGA